MRTADGAAVLRLDDHDVGVDTPWGLLTTTVDGTIVDVNPRFASWTGRSHDALRGGLRWKQLLAPASKILYETHFVPRLEARGAVSEVALDLAREDGSRFPILASALRRTGADGREATTITVFDATETRRFETVLRGARRDAEAAAEALAVSNKSLRAKHEQLRVTLRSIADAVMTTDVDGRITSFNPTAEEITGLSGVEAIGAPITAVGRLLDAASRRPIDLRRLLTEPSMRTSTELLLVRPDGCERQVEGTVAPIRDERRQIEGSVLVWRDMTERRAEATRREHEAMHDPLTGLLNRREFERRVSLALAADARGASDLLLCIDLDEFKVVNDTAGPTAGDQLLIQVGQLLRESLRQTDVLARLGGDEFGVLLSQCPLVAGTALSEVLRRRLEDFRFVWGDRVHSLTASIGLAVLPERDGSADAALASADMACRAAKEAGRNRVRSVEAGDADLRHRRDEMDWVSRIRRDLSENRFELFFQPIVRVDGAPERQRHGELLLRLRDGEGRLVAPGAFIGAAERYHQMGHLDRWVVRAAFDWLDGIADVQASINISGQSFGDADFLGYVVEQMAGRRFDPPRVCFEITETAAIADLPAALRFIACLRERGCRFSLDDFGAGLSSFGYLRSLPVDFVKIDGSFVKSMIEDPVNRAIVESIHRVARLCGLQTVAEWVENEGVLAALGEIGIDFAQGWCTGRPVPIADV